VGKRSDFVRIERDWYATPYVAILPLLPHLPEKFEFTEICAGNGALIDHLEKHGGTCVLKTDIEPQRSDIIQKDFFEITHFPAMPILNPPWNRKILHPLMDHLLKHTDEFWLLFDSDWAYTKQSSEYMVHCEKIVAIGRLKWIEGSTMTGKDNCAWYKFTKETHEYSKYFGR
jgi:hypothetical protein